MRKLRKHLRPGRRFTYTSTASGPWLAAELVALNIQEVNKPFVVEGIADVNLKTGEVFPVFNVETGMEVDTIEEED